MSVTKEERGRLNMFATEPRMYIDHDYVPTYRIIMNEKAERINGLAAMLGVVAALGAYATTGQIIPGLW